MATAYDNWKQQTPEDEEHDRRDAQDAAKARIERLIYGFDGSFTVPTGRRTGQRHYYRGEAQSSREE